MLRTSRTTVRSMSLVVALACLLGMGAGCQLEANGPVRTLLVIEPNAENPRNSEGDIIELKDGRLALVYTRFTGGSSDHAAADLALRTSSDGGTSWSDDRILVEHGTAKNVMSVSLRRLPDGELLLFYLRKNSLSDCQMEVRRSRDEWGTLSEPVRVTSGDGYHVVNNDRVLLTTTGRLIVPAARHAWSDQKHHMHSPYAAPIAYYSDDGGHTWQAGTPATTDLAPPAPVFQEPGVVELRDGRIMMYLRTDQSSQFICYSSDGGKSWSRPQASSLISAPFSPASIESIGRGKLLCIWNDHTGLPSSDNRSPLSAAISTDDALTWQPSQVLEGDPKGWYCYTSMTPLKNRVLLSYCAGHSRESGLNRLKVVAIPRGWFRP